jgi:hypothetical protein
VATRRFSCFAVKDNIDVAGMPTTAAGPDFALLGSAVYAVLVHRLVIYAPRFLPTVDYSSAVALHFAHCGQLATGLSPAGVRPCWAHAQKKTPTAAGWRFLLSMPKI